ncbi:MAG: hypothetical protein GX436_01140 [Synergistaceae bacterium]|nr:hypothetical protein [Synergistaceae bacterium]
MNEKILHRLNRFFAWLLVPVLSLNFLSGYAVVHPRLFGALLSKPAAFRLHMAIQPPTVGLFLFHVLYHLRIVLSRRGLRGPLSDLAFGAAWLAGTAAACWIAGLG